MLLHISSLPAGNFGENAYKFVDFLAAIGASIWQTLPLNMPHDDGSPYQCLSAHAGRLAFISLDGLVSQGLLAKDDFLPTDDGVQPNRHALFNKSYINYKLQKNQSLQKQFVTFCRQNAAWLNDFALFLVLRKKFNKTAWNIWPKAYKNKQPAQMAKVKLRYATDRKSNV